MNKQQRKREAREKKARAKEARKAKALRESGGDRSADAVGDLPTACAGKDARTTDAGRDAHITEDAHITPDAHTTKGAHTTITPSMTQEELRADPELMEAVLASQLRDEESFELKESADEASRELKWARDMVKQVKQIRQVPHVKKKTLQKLAENGDPSTGSGQAVRRISDQRALEMLEDAAEATHDVLLMVRDALRGVSPERRAAAREVLNAKPQTGTDGRRLPRRAPDPVVTLEKISLQAASLLKRILAKTNPNAGKKAA